MFVFFPGFQFWSVRYAGVTGCYRWTGFCGGGFIRGVGVVAVSWFLK